MSGSSADIYLAMPFHLLPVTWSGHMLAHEQVFDSHSQVYHRSQKTLKIFYKLTALPDVK